MKGMMKYKRPMGVVGSTLASVASKDAALARVAKGKGKTGVARKKSKMPPKEMDYSESGGSGEMHGKRMGYSKPYMSAATKQKKQA